MVNKRLVAVVTMLAIAVLLLPVQPVGAAILPPRPAPLPESSSGSEFTEEGCVASIALHVHFSRVEQAYRWQELRTVVEWQDGLGNWHKVEGWQGALDEVVEGVGRKVWWISRANLGTGPFRWTVYRDSSGKRPVYSEAFRMPDAVGQLAIVDVTVGP
ncbi:MAG: hypothetical protein WHX52_09490 [Anaerolineae bacterium]